MRYVLITLVFMTAAVFAVCEIGASPAATQTWVKNYVATNTVVSATSSNIVVRLSGASSASIYVLQMGGVNAVQNASDAAVQSAANAVKIIYDECVGF